MKGGNNMALIQVTPDLLNSKANELRTYKDQHDEAMAKMRSLSRLSCATLER